MYGFTGTYSKKLQANTAACLSALVKHHHDNQNLIITKGAVKPLVKQLRNTSSLCQVKAATALEALAKDNPEAQDIIDQADAARPLIRLLKVWSIEVKEQGNIHVYDFNNK
jgi:hypothetical protein